MKHYNLTITGRLQGVAFRASARDQAMQLGIQGFVRNQPNGSVYIEAEGSEEALGQFVAWCRQGPPMAFVENVDIQEGTTEHFQAFKISH